MSEEVRSEPLTQREREVLGEALWHAFYRTDISDEDKAMIPDLRLRLLTKPDQAPLGESE